MVAEDSRKRAQPDKLLCFLSESMTQSVPISGSRTFVPERIGRYEIVGELGQGGMGAIYLGRASGLGGFERLVAIKMIHRHLSREKQFIDMFLDEARIAASIRHPHVVSVFDVGEEDGRYYIAMDYVSGDPFSILLDRTWGRGVTMPAHAMAHVVAIACEGLHAAHELEDPMTRRPLGVVHRDICPQNILVGYDGIVRLMDFGVAKAAGQIALTNPGVHKGKVPYMSPEQVKGAEIDRRADVFAMGVVLWEATVGRRLFKDENDLRSAARVLRGRVPKPTNIIEGYPLELEGIVMRALDAKPERRYQTARELGDALQSFIAFYGRLSARDVADLMRTHCQDRLERKKEIERRASVETLGSTPILGPTTQELFVGDEQLPSHDLESDVEAEDLEEVSAVLLGLAGAAEAAAAEPKTQQLDLRSPGFAVVPTEAPEDEGAEKAFFTDKTSPSGLSDAPTQHTHPLESGPAKYTLPIAVAVASAAVLGLTFFLSSGEPETPDAVAGGPFPAKVGAARGGEREGTNEASPGGVRTGGSDTEAGADANRRGATDAVGASDARGAAARTGTSDAQGAGDAARTGTSDAQGAGDARGTAARTDTSDAQGATATEGEAAATRDAHGDAKTRATKTRDRRSRRTRGDRKTTDRDEDKGRFLIGPEDL